MTKKEKENRYKHDLIRERKVREHAEMKRHIHAMQAWLEYAGQQDKCGSLYYDAQLLLAKLEAE